MLTSRDFGFQTQAPAKQSDRKKLRKLKLSNSRDHLVGKETRRNVKDLVLDWNTSREERRERSYNSRDPFSQSFRNPVMLSTQKFDLSSFRSSTLHEPASLTAAVTPSRRHCQSKQLPERMEGTKHKEKASFLRMQELQ